MTIDGIESNDIDFDCTSARCDFINCSTHDVSLTTVSGDLYYSGSLDALTCEGVSAKYTVELLSPAKEIELNCVSGDLTLALTADTGFTASIDSLSGNISTEFDTTASGDRYIYGDGSCNIEADTASGDIIIKKRK